MSKVKLRCTTCGKWFQSANAKEVTCPDCVQKARREKMAAKTTPPANTTSAMNASTRAVPPPPKPKAAEGPRWFEKVEDVKIGQPDQPPPKPKIPPSPAPRDSRGQGGYRDRDERGPGSYRPGGPGTLEPGYRPRQPMEGGFPRGPRPGTPGEARPGMKRDKKPPKAKTPKPPTPPKPKREKIPPPQPFVPTPEQVAQIETRYLELAQPTEFDGIRTQISKELSIPKKAVKKVVKELRARNNIPSWWETQEYKGDSEELAKIKAAYEPYLPVPPVGVHKTIADALELKAGTVYQAIKAIRQELNLPQYNDPALHAEELAALKQAREAKAKAKAAEKSDEAAKTTEDEAAKTTEAATSESETGKEESAPAPAATEEPPTPVEVAAAPADEKSSTNAENS